VRAFVGIAGLCGLLLTVSANAGAASVAAPIGSMPYIDHRNQPPYLPLPAAVAEQ
jgi:hypothetical protein